MFFKKMAHISGKVLERAETVSTVIFEKKFKN